GAAATCALPRVPPGGPRASPGAGPLLHTPEQLDAALVDLAARGRSRDPYLIVEFDDTADRDGVYRKYSAFVVGSRLIPGHMLASKNWVTKRFDTQDEAWHREEREFVRANPHARPRQPARPAARRDLRPGRHPVRAGRLRRARRHAGHLGDQHQPYLAAPEPFDSPRYEACAESARQINEALAAVDSPADASAWTLTLWPGRVRAGQRRVLHAGLRSASGRLAGQDRGPVAADPRPPAADANSPPACKPYSTLTESHSPPVS